MVLNITQALSQTPYNEATKSFIIEMIKKKLKNAEIFLYQDNEEGSNKIILISYKIEIEKNSLQTYFFLYNNLLKKGPTIVFQGNPSKKLKDEYNNIIAKSTLKFKYESLLKWNNKIDFFDEIVKVIQDKFKKSFPFIDSNKNIYYDPICTLEDATLIKVSSDTEGTILKGNSFKLKSQINLEDNIECNTIEHQKLRKLISEKKNQTLKNQINYFQQQNNNINNQIKLIKEENKKVADDINELHKYKNIYQNLLTDYEKTENNIKEEINKLKVNDDSIENLINKFVNVPNNSKTKIELQSKIDTIENFLLTLKTGLGKNAINIKEGIKAFRKNSQDIFYVHHKIKQLGV